MTVFSSGVALGIAAMATGPALRWWRCPRPDRVLRSVLPQLRANHEVRDPVRIWLLAGGREGVHCLSLTLCVKVRGLVGSALQPGLFRAHSYSGGLQWRGVRHSGVSLRNHQIQPCKTPPLPLSLTHPPSLPPSLSQLQTVCRCYFKYMERHPVPWSASPSETTPSGGVVSCLTASSLIFLMERDSCLKAVPQTLSFRDIHHSHIQNENIKIKIHIYGNGVGSGPCIW